MADKQFTPFTGQVINLYRAKAKDHITVTQGTQVKVTKLSDNGEDYYCEVDDKKKGWVPKGYIKAPGTSSTIQASPTQQQQHQQGPPPIRSTSNITRGSGSGAGGPTSPARNPATRATGVAPGSPAPFARGRGGGAPPGGNNSRLTSQGQSRSGILASSGGQIPVVSTTPVEKKETPPAEVKKQEPAPTSTTTKEPEGVKKTRNGTCT